MYDLTIPTNEYQTPINNELFESLPEEVAEQLIEIVNTVPYIKNLISPNRKRAKDLPRDDRGRIVVDLSDPHILEDMDYFRPAALHFEKHGCYTFLKPNPNPNSEYRKYIDEEKRRIREGYVRESDGEWVTGYMYWYLNYCPIMLTKTKKGKKKADRVEGFPEVWEGVYLRFHYLEKARDLGHHAIELARRGAHPYTEKVFTPGGWKLWGEINIGDSLFGTDGTITKVTDIPYDKEAPYYNVTLRDGRTIQASDDHKWVVCKKGKTLIKTTKELLSIYKKARKVTAKNPKGVEYEYFIPSNEGVDLPHKPTNVDPYTFGLLLGDGCFRHDCCYFTQADEDIEEEKKHIPYELVKWNQKYSYRICIPNWVKILKEYDLYWVKSEDKFIPDEYKYNSKEVRLNLLTGLLDSDGWVHNSVPTLDTVSERLRDDVLELARSLGYNASYCSKDTKYKKGGTYIPCKTVYTISIYAGKEVFNLKRKKDKIKESTNIARSRKTAIVNIEYVGTTKCKCVTVDAADSCYLIGDFVTTHNCGKSYGLAAMMSHNLILGESVDAYKRVTTILTAYQKEYLADKDGTLSKFEPMINFVSENTEFPRLRLRSSSQEMFWQMGYLDKYGRKKGSLNSVIGVSSKDDSGKLRGKRGHIYFEEMGSFPNLLEIFDVVRQGMEEGDYTYGLAFLVGTAAEKESNFESAKTLLYNPTGYNIMAIKNVYDKPRQGNPEFGYFFPAYVNRKGCYNKDGVSDVVQALVQILIARHKAKYSANPNSVLRIIAEMPVTPAEAIVKVKNAYFPVATLSERKHQLDMDSKAFDDVYVGNLVLNNKGEVVFKPSEDTPIRSYGVDNSTRGALEIFEMPQKDSSGMIPQNRYIIGHDPVDNDQAESSSLSSTFVLDMFTDRIVAEYTGRQTYADDNYEIVRLLCLFYNARCLYEAHPYSQIVRLPDGSTKEWGDIKVGDTLLSLDGSTTKVIDIPMDGEDDIYRLTLGDGRIVEASSNHKWVINKCNHKDALYETTTIEMYNQGVKNKYNQHRFFIPESGAVQYPAKETTIDPYTLGLLIAEGALTKFKKNKRSSSKRSCVQISSSKEDMEFYKTVIPYPIKYIGTKGYSWHMYIDNIDNKLKELGLLHCDSSHKFIPAAYLFNSHEVRLQLLKGLMDGDGCAVKKGASIFVTTSKQLAQDVALLCRSIGLKASIANPRLNVYRVAIVSTIPIFLLPRKIKSQHIYKPYEKGSKASAFIYKTPIVKIEYIGKRRCKCVTVDRADGLYLIGDYVLTHNCNKKGIFPYFKRMNATHLLAETPQFLRDKQMIKYSSLGSSAYGVNATNAINNYANERIRDWLLQPMPIITKNDEGEEVQTTLPHLFSLRNRALLEELIAFDPVRNFDRIRALGMVMIYREEIISLNGGRPTGMSEDYSRNGLEMDDFFERNYKVTY